MSSSGASSITGAPDFFLLILPYGLRKESFQDTGLCKPNWRPLRRAILDMASSEGRFFLLASSSIPPSPCQHSEERFSRIGVLFGGFARKIGGVSIPGLAGGILLTYLGVLPSISNLKGHRCSRGSSAKALELHR